MNRLSFWCAVLLLAISPRLAAAGLDLTWNACNTSASGADDVALNCDGSSGASLFGNFQSPQAMASFLAMDVVLDVRAGAGTLPPFWHFESGGCNAGGLGVSDAKPAALCPNVSNGNLWGPSGNDAVAAITAYVPGLGGQDRLRILLTISRVSTNPLPVAAGQNYFGFELDLTTDNASSCSGCTTPAVIGWSTAVLYGSTQTVEVSQSGTRLTTVALNGGIPGPTVLTVRPESGESSTPASVDLIGRNLAAGTTARLVRSGQADIAGTGTTTSTKGDVLRTTFDIVNRPDGFWNVEVSDPEGGANGLASAFRTIGGFTVDSLYPRLGARNTTVMVTIYGSQLIAPASVRLMRPNYTDIVGIGTTVAVDGKSLQTSLGLQTADLGVLEVEVTNGDGAKQTVPGGLEAVIPLVVSSVSPNVGADTGPVVLAVGGTGIRSGAMVSLRRTNDTDIVGDVLAVDPLGTSLQARFDLLNRAPGLWDLVLMNPGGLPVTAGSVLMIRGPLQVTSIEPRVGSNSGSLPVMIAGTNMETAASVKLTRSGEPPIVGSVLFENGRDSIAATFDLTGRALGLWNVEVVSINSLIGTLPDGFEIRNGPSVSGTAPNAAVDTSIVTLQISGSDIQPGATTRLTRVGVSDIPGTSVAVSGEGSSLTADFDVRGRSGGPWSVLVTNPDGASASILNGFTIHTFPVPSAIVPTVGSNARVVFAEITGNRFLTGLSVRLEKPSVPAIVGTVIAVDAEGTRIDASFSLVGKNVGSYDVVVTNPGGYEQRLNAAFEVLDVLKILKVTPTTAVDSAFATLVVSGVNLVPGATMTLTRDVTTFPYGNNGESIPATTASVGPGDTSITATFDIRRKTEDAWNVTVTNPDGASSKLANAFTIRSKPIVELILPSSGQNTHVVDARVYGSGFQWGLTVWLQQPPSPPFPAIWIVNYTLWGYLDVRFDLTGRPPGLYDVIVINASLVAGRHSEAFEIRPALEITSVAPDAVPDTSLATVVVSGAGLASDATVKLTRSGDTDIVATDVTADPAGTSLTATFDIRGRAVWTWNLVITSPDRISVSLQNGFTILSVPAVTAIQPASGTDGDASFATVITGGGFVAGLSARLERASDPAIPGVVSQFATGSANVQFDLRTASTGLYDVVVVNPGNLIARLPAAFEVRAVPHIVSFAPVSAPDTSRVVCTIAGKLFDSGATAQLVAETQPTIVGTETAVSGDRRSLTTTFDLRGQASGPRTVRIVQEDGTELTADTLFWAIENGLVDVPSRTPGEELALVSVAPNPTSGSATVTFTLAAESAVRLIVSDLMGREVAELARGTRPPGRHGVRWDGRGRQGPAPTGMYFVRMEAGGRTFMKRFVLAR